METESIQALETFQKCIKQVLSPEEDFESFLSGIVCCILILQLQITKAHNQYLLEHNFIFNISGKESNSSLRLSDRLING